MRIEYLSKNYPQRLYQELINIEDQAEKDSYIRKIINVAYNVGHLTILEMIVDNIKENQLITPETEVDFLYCLIRNMPTTCIKLIKNYEQNQAVLNSSIGGVGETPLMITARYGMTDVVNALAQAKADIEAKDKYGMRALMLAAASGKTDVVQVLIDAGADKEAKDNYGKTALMHAAEMGNTYVVNALIDAGADKEAKDRSNKTALMYAAEYGGEDVVKALIEAGADKEAKDNNGNAALIYAVLCGKTDVVKFLIAAGADKEAQDDYGNTALMYAAMEGRTDVVKALIEAGADKEAKDFSRNTALIYAALFGKTDVVKYLIEAGADKEAKDNGGKTALMIASKDGHKDVVEFLIAAGADKEAQNDDGNTALMYAAMEGRTDVVKALIDAGADVNYQNHYNGQTALGFALMYQHPNNDKVISYLLRAGASFDDTKYKKVDPAIKEMALKYQKEHSHPTLSSLRKLIEGRVKIDSLDQDLHLEDKKQKLLTQISMQGFGPSQLKEKLKDDKLDKALLFDSLGLDVSGLDAKQIGKLTKTAIKILDKEDNPNIERLAEQLVVKTEMLKIKNNLEHSQSSGKSFADGVTESRKQAGEDQGNFWSKLCHLQ